ncbi:hypothetical protein [Phytoactinopolyspora mesophila]|uniref:Uncharacterized protein n=1 Tax=Phytoactinopolyspora mesophila TaxID=2650750 RepID=A0A7K3M5M9_9ACTN|nr:hypothetical protein [Phytoactinopolyspora mesophila]NDL58624.1 hypothetical protein [Phytoactinopolyspora mesophila]
MNANTTTVTRKQQHKLTTYRMIKGNLETLQRSTTASKEQIEVEKRLWYSLQRLEHELGI